MDIVDADIDSLKDLDSEEEDPEFQRFLYGIIDGKKFSKVRNSEKKGMQLTKLIHFIQIMLITVVETKFEPQQKMTNRNLLEQIKFL